MRYTLKYIADFIGVSERELARITSENFENLYRVKLSYTEKTGCEVSDYKIEKIMDREFEE